VRVESPAGHGSPGVIFFARARVKTASGLLADGSLFPHQLLELLRLLDFIEPLVMSFLIGLERESYSVRDAARAIGDIVPTGHRGLDRQTEAGNRRRHLRRPSFLAYFLERLRRIASIETVRLRLCLVVVTQVPAKIPSAFAGGLGDGSGAFGIDRLLVQERDANRYARTPCKL